MKMFRKAMALCLSLCLCLVFGAVIFRIYIAEHYPEGTVRMVFTEPLAEYYEANKETFAPETQYIRFPYDSADDGNFFAAGLIVVKEAGNLQITMRYNESALGKVAEFYKLTSPITPDQGLFRYTLTASHNETEDGSDFRTYDASFVAEDNAYMYRYAKLAFDGVDFDGAVWMRVDIYYGEEEKPFGHICIYEARAFDGENMVDMAFTPYDVDKEDLPK